MSTPDPLHLQYQIGYLEGKIEGITLYAIWRNGEQKVGCMERPLKTVLRPYQDELAKLTSAGAEAKKDGESARTLAFSLTRTGSSIPPTGATLPPPAPTDSDQTSRLSPHRNDLPEEPRGGLSGERGGGAFAAQNKHVQPLIKDILDQLCY